MNSLKTLNTLFIVVLTLLMTNTTYAQFSVGGGLAYGSEIKELAINVRAGYQISEEINGNVGYSYFLAGEGVGFNTIDIDGHYAFWSNETIDAYGLTGLNIAIASVDVVGLLEGSDSSFGLNLGAGGRYNLSEKLGAFLEIKYVISDFNQLIPELGVIYKL